MEKKISILFLTGAILINNIVPIFAMDNILTLSSVKIDNEEIAIDINNVAEGAIKTSFVNYNKEEYYLPETGTLGIIPYIIMSLITINAGIFIYKKKRRYY